MSHVKPFCGGFYGLLGNILPSEIVRVFCTQVVVFCSCMLSGLGVPRAGEGRHLSGILANTGSPLTLRHCLAKSAWTLGNWGEVLFVVFSWENWIFICSKMGIKRVIKWAGVLWGFQVFFQSNNSRTWMPPLIRLKIYTESSSNRLFRKAQSEEVSPGFPWPLWVGLMVCSIRIRIALSLRILVLLKSEQFR